MTTTAVAATVETNPLLVAVVSVTLTLGVGIVVGLLSGFLARKGEHAKWLRERRFDAYVAFMIDMNSLSDIAHTTPTLQNATALKARIDSLPEKTSAAFEAVSLLGPRTTNAAGQKWVRAITVCSHEKTAPNDASLSAARWNFLVAAGRILKSRNVTATPTSNPNEIPALP